MISDEQLWKFLEQRGTPSADISDEWIAQAKAAILSDDLPTNAASGMTGVDAARYICRLLHVLLENKERKEADIVINDVKIDPFEFATFGLLHKASLRAAFVRGIALRGGDPMEASLLYTQGMEEAKLRELVEFDTSFPPEERDWLFLTGAGRVVAEMALNEWRSKTAAISEDDKALTKMTEGHQPEVKGDTTPSEQQDQANVVITELVKGVGATANGLTEEEIAKMILRVEELAVNDSNFTVSGVHARRYVWAQLRARGCSPKDIQKVWNGLDFTIREKLGWQKEIDDDQRNKGTVTKYANYFKRDFPDAPLVG